MTPEEWMASGQNATATDEVLKQHADARGSAEAESEVEAVPWVSEEELVRPASPVRLRPTGHFRALARGALLLAVFVVLAGLLRDVLPALAPKSDAGLLLPLSGKHHSA